MAKEQTPQQPQSSETPQKAEQTAPAAAEVPSDAKTMAMLCHLLAIFTGFIGPLIIWLVKKADHPFIDEQGKEALNFQITVLLAMIVSFLLSFLCIGFFLMPAVGVVNLVFCIIATIKVNGGDHYRYPVSLRLIK
jgi:uncharacterized Tic20 family protein